MALIEHTLFGTVNKVDQAIQRLKSFEPDDGYCVADSGGKDSKVIHALCHMAGVKHEAHYSVVTVDPPELVQFQKQFRKSGEVIFDYPKYPEGKTITMWNLIPNKGIPPTRLKRYCCEVLKESSGKGRVTVTGVRWKESNNRKANQGLIQVRTSTKGGAVKEVSKYTETFRITKRGG